MARVFRPIVFLACLSILALGAGPAVSQVADYTVTRADDPVPDGCAPGDCSLREAVIDADVALGTPTISVPAGVYVLSIPSPPEANPAVGDLDVSGEIIIEGAGPTTTILNANGLVTGQRAFDLRDSASLTIRGMTITGGRTTDQGGAFRVFTGSLTLEDVAITENETVSNSSGGIHGNTGTSVTLTDVVVSHNTAGSFGGGLLLSGNAALTNVTISGNASEDAGGGLLINGNMATLTNVTITDNTGETDNMGGLGGGGLAQNAATVVVRNSIIAGNRVGATGTSPDCDGTIVSEGGNVIQDTSGCTFTPAAADITGQAAGLGPLTDNGGPTATHALLAGSPAIDRGGSGCAATDQRGATRTGPCDSGAYELVQCMGTLVNRVGTEGNDILTGTDGDDGFLLLGGNDQAAGGGGNDAFCSGEGNDVLKGQGGNDRVLAGPGRDKAVGGPGKDRLRGEAGKDLLKGSGGADNLNGGSGKDRCVGQGGRDKARACERTKTIP
jgi:hypothetical protein